jgi:1-acyl-sn-glycerol-3-phosphate acyltransferase
MLEGLLETLSGKELHEAFDRIAQTSPDYDQWGYSPKDSQAFARFGYLAYKYFRPEVTGIENIPAGRVLIVPNHSGQLPFDGLVIGISCLLHARPPRLLRAMAERWFPQLPYVNVFFSRAGVVVGDPINCRNLLESDNAILVFPEGAKGSGKTWWNRYQLTNFGRGFMRLALQTKTPVVPVSVVGAEESIVSLYNAKSVANKLGMPYLPIPALLPVLGPLAFLPLPTKFYVDFGKPLTFEGPFDDEDEVIDKKVQVVKDTVQGMIDRRRAARSSVF